MVVLSASNISKSYGTDVILDDISFHINSGDKVGIIGSNGAGKTTLMNILAGRTTADSGEFFVARDNEIGYLRQRDSFCPEDTVIETVEAVFSNLIKMEKEIELLTSQIAESHADKHDELWQRLNSLQHNFERAGGYKYRSEMMGVLSSMSFGADYYERKTDTLSGGELTRLALACILLRKPKILFLDEPTNHLDIGALKWLEQYLKAYSSTLVIVSHDRYFLDEVVDRIFEISNHKLSTYYGNYTQYIEKKKAMIASRQKAYKQQQEEIKRQEELIRIYKQRGTEKLAKRAKSREKLLGKIDVLDNPEEHKKVMNIKFGEDVKSGNDVISGYALSASFESDKALFQNVDFDIKRGETICIVGANGIGKTTLLKIIAGIIPPRSGVINRGFNVEFGYYDQGQKLLDDSLTVMEQIHGEYRTFTNSEIRSILGRFLFTGDTVFREVGSLSGGEKARLALLKLMMSGANVLLLDEPTNHLDIESKEAFEAALSEYSGTVITVTHDRYFLKKMADRIFELNKGGVTNYLGGYEYYMEKKNSIRSTKEYLSAKTPSPSSLKNNSNLHREQQKKVEAETRRNKREKKHLEAQIEALEINVSEIEDKMCDTNISTDYEAMTELSNELHELKEKLENAYESWLELDTL